MQQTPYHIPLKAGTYKSVQPRTATVRENGILPREIHYLDLFSGTGGFAKGLLKAGFTFKTHNFSEIDTFSVANYLYHFNHAKNLNDIKKVKGSQIRRPNLITFGSPCQDLSLAGKQKGLKGKRSGLFFEALRLIGECKPDVFIFENVKGLFSSNKGKDFEVVLKAFADLGLYDVQWQLLNTRWFLPQSRERVYLVGHLRKDSRPQIFPIGHSNRLSQTLGDTGKEPKPKIVINELNGIPPVLKEVIKEGDSINVSYLYGRSPVGKNIAYAVTGSKQSTLKKGRLRMLTPVECERLQGFPDNWTQLGLFDGELKAISDSQRYKMLGNAVSVPVVTAVAEKLLQPASPTPSIDQYERVKRLALELGLWNYQPARA